MNPEVHSDFQWLVSEDAKEGLAAAQELFAEKINPLKIAKFLRKSMSPDRAAVVMEQAQLRLRGRKKFAAADRMFFTGRSLQQSSAELLADYKTNRFAECEHVADVCCGIGGDLLSLARKVPRVTGVDRDPIAVLFAGENATANEINNIELQCASFEDIDVTGFDGLHFDPDRRVGQKRTTSTHHFQPNLADIVSAIDPSRQRVGIKIAPGSALAEQFAFPVEREWVGDSRECKQQILWMGPDVAVSAVRSTVVAKDGRPVSFCVAVKEETCPGPPKSTFIGPYIYEPHATAIAAGLVNDIAAHYQLQALCSGISWLNSEETITGVDPLLRGYRVKGVFTVDLKSLAAELNDRDIGRLVVKKRGIDQVLVDKISRLKLKGSKKGILMVTRHGRLRRAILVERIRDSG